MGKCAEFAAGSLLIYISEKWNSGNKNLIAISEELHLDISTVYKYMQQGAEYGICEFDKAQYVASVRKKPHSNKGIHIQCVETNEIFTSIRQANLKYKTKIKKEYIDNPDKICGGYHWISV